MRHLPSLALLLLATTTGLRAQTDGVDARKELLITDLSVVEDPVRTGPGGPWSFGHLARALAGPGQDASDLILAWLETWEQPHIINGFQVDPRGVTGPGTSTIRRQVIDPWPRRPDGKLDLDRAPMRLLAIVNRMDLARRGPQGEVLDAGEGRFVFGVLDRSFGGEFAKQFTVILEYGLLASSPEALRDWAARWHELGALPQGELYNRALAALTERFAGRDAAPHKANGNALNQLRTSELDLFSFPWEFRQFRLVDAGGLELTTTSDAPDFQFQLSTQLAQLINDNEAQVLDGSFVVPPALLGGVDKFFFQTWAATGVTNPEARHRFAIRTCSGCHSSETGTTSQFMIAPRQPGQEAQLSSFLTGGVVPDPVTGTPRSFDELAKRRAALLRALQPPLQVIRTPQAVREAPFSIALGPAFSAPPLLLAQMQTRYSVDTAGVRVLARSATSASIAVQEETSWDAETKHGAEVVGLLAIAPGAIRDAAGATVGESGSRTLQAGQWTPVSLSRTYQDPVVLAQVLTTTDPAPALVRVRAVSPRSFEVSLAGWQGAHLPETVAWVVMERGRHVLPGGEVLQAGRLTTSATGSSFPPLTFPVAFATQPVVLSQVQTEADPEPVITRQRAVSATGFRLQLQERERNLQDGTGAHAAESVGYLAISGP